MRWSQIISCHSNAVDIQTALEQNQIGRKKGLRSHGAYNI